MLDQKENAILNINSKKIVLPYITMFYTSLLDNVMFFGTK